MSLLLTVLAVISLASCNKAAPPPPAMHALPVQVSSVTLTPVPQSDTYVSTVKSRRSATLQPQVDGNLTRILVHSGQAVASGQLLMQIDPLKQVATVEAQQGTQAQLKATYQYTQTELDRQRKLFEAGVTSRDAYDQAIQNFDNSKGALSSAQAATDTQKQQLAYYQIRAPFAGIVGDIPVHLGDYVSATTLLTTVDEHKDLEAYIYVPTERAAQLRMGLPVEIQDTAGKTLAKTTISFLSPEVDNGTQGILAKASLGHTTQMIRTDQLVNARIIWSTAPAPVVPILAVTRIGGQPFVYLAEPAPAPPAAATAGQPAAGGQSGAAASPAPSGPAFVAKQVAVTLGETVGNNYPVLSGLKQGDRVILSGLQFLQDGVPVQPLN